jgi:hypothetical protein
MEMMMKKTAFLMSLLMTFGMFVVAIAGNGPPARDAIWADGALYATVATPTHLPNHGPKDGIFAFPNYPSQRSVAESKPGDQDYNGGRWQVYLIDVVNPGNLPGELTSWEEVQNYINSGDLEMIGLGPSFVCPMIPQH